VWELIKIKTSASPTTPASGQSISDGMMVTSGTRISPAPGESVPAEGMELEQGETGHVHVGFEIPPNNIARNENTGVRSALEDYTTNPDNRATTLDILDKLYVGTMS
jgi:hypothetical protein